MVFYFDIYNQDQNGLMNQKDSTYEFDHALENPLGENVTTKDPTEGLITLIGKNQKEVEDKLGKPERIFI